MKTTAFVSVLLAVLAAVLHADGPRIMHASFPDGTGLEIFTETTGSTQIDSEGSMGIFQDVVNRMVIDRANNVLFAYNLEASRGTDKDTVMVRIMPFSDTAEAWQKDFAKIGLHVSGQRFPTVAAIREFPAVKIGEVVTLDILYNPSTGEKIYDVLRPITGAGTNTSVVAVLARQTISLKQISIRVNGQAMSAPASWMIGAAVRIDMPGHGTYVVAADDPHSVSRDRTFATAAHAEGKTLSWTMGSDHVEITSATNVLTQSGTGVLWVYHDPLFRSQDQPNAVRLQAADTVEWLLPKR